MLFHCPGFSSSRFGCNTTTRSRLRNGSTNWMTISIGTIYVQ
ncbi:hypothetical protein LG3211_1190 [Lysobacter gummosus]|nr:hypothetical protein LG3211_1190 [Lysobacter gummosus]